MTTEEKLKEKILEEYKTLKNFVDHTTLKYSTVDSILKRGIMNSNVQNIIEICKVLNISTDELAKGNIVEVTEEKPNIEVTAEVKRLRRLAAYAMALNGHKLSEEEKNELFDNFDLVVNMMEKKIERKKSEVKSKIH